MYLTPFLGIEYLFRVFVINHWTSFLGCPLSKKYSCTNFLWLAQIAVISEICTVDTLPVIIKSSIENGTYWHFLDKMSQIITIIMSVHCSKIFRFLRLNLLNCESFSLVTHQLGYVNSPKLVFQSKIFLSVWNEKKNLSGPVLNFNLVRPTMCIFLIISARGLKLAELTFQVMAKERRPTSIEALAPLTITVKRLVGFESTSSIDLIMNLSLSNQWLIIKQLFLASEPPGIISNSLVLFAKLITQSTFPWEKMGKLSKILFRSLFISSTLAQSDTQDDSSESQTFQVTECNDETDDVSWGIEIRWV